MKKILVAMLCVVGFAASSSWAVERPYTQGSVWTVTFVRVKPGMDLPYLRDLASGWKQVMEAARSQQLVLSYKVLEGNLTGRDDWNLMLLVESKNWAAFDGADDRFDAIVEKMIGPEKQQMEQMIKRSDMREIVGVKNLQEIRFK